MFLMQKPRTGLRKRSFQTFQTPRVSVLSNYVKSGAPLFERDPFKHFKAPHWLPFRI